METTIQEQFDALVAQHGAEAVVEAIKGHINPNADTGCQKGYVMVNGVCKLDVGN